MARVSASALFVVLAEASFAASPVAAAQLPLERVPDSPDSLLRVAPIEPERIRPPPTSGLAVPSVPGRQTFVLRYRPTPSEDPSKIPGPVVLHVPDEYDRFRAHGPVEVWDLLFLLLHPSLKPATPAERRCGQNWCGDEMTVLVQLGPDSSPRTPTGSVRDWFTTTFLARDGIVAYETVPAPPGYEEAFTATHTFKPDRPNSMYLVYRDERGGRRIGLCYLDVLSPNCQFQMFDPEMHLQTLYTFPTTLLPQRQAIEDGLRGLVGGWRAAGR